jgi:predicted transcriptional regulator
MTASATHDRDISESGPAREQSVDEYMNQILADAPAMSDAARDFFTETLGPSVRACKAAQVAAEDAQQAATAIQQVAEEARYRTELARLAIEQGLRVMTLDEVAEITHVAVSYLARECQAGRLEHVRSGRLRGMTAEQVRRLIRACTKAADRIDQMDDIDMVRIASRKNAARATRRRPSGSTGG